MDQSRATIYTHSTDTKTNYPSDYGRLSILEQSRARVGLDAGLRMSAVVLHFPYDSVGTRAIVLRHHGGLRALTLSLFYNFSQLFNPNILLKRWQCPTPAPLSLEVHQVPKDEAGQTLKCSEQPAGLQNPLARYLRVTICHILIFFFPSLLQFLKKLPLSLIQYITFFNFQLCCRVENLT